MERVGLDRERARRAHDIALVLQQHEGDHDREPHDRDPERSVVHRLHVDKPVPGLEDEEDRGARDEGRLAQPGERLRLAMTEAVLAVGRHERVANGHEIDDGGSDIEQRIDEGGEERHRIGHQIGADLS